MIEPCNNPGQRAIGYANAENPQRTYSRYQEFIHRMRASMGKPISIRAGIAIILPDARSAERC